uniref:Integrase, catalytic region, zinc finger, CCHC-type, peptidase aspartic, catalytic n=1 Tax=Tanacetum cinerariifolium TaxID=118510 RepID=A0A699JAL2_TANCI|nr:integrase, catalytic region, zinc finger, CCHC-type, peptidase aspartic, catalytic [Tanacetum cinerariifolium]
MDLCGPMSVESVNRKKYILVIVNDYSRFTWVKCLRSKDEAPDFIIKFLKMIQVRLKVPICRIRTDNETEFINQTLREYYEEVSISHETSVARSPQQNNVVERRNRLQISQSPRGIFINQSKYALESLKKYGFESYDPVDTPIVEKSKLDEDKERKAVDSSHYRGSAYQKAHTCSKRIFRYLHGIINRGLWYPKDSSVALTASAYVNHAGCQDTSHSTSGSLQFLEERLINWSLKRYHFIKEQVENEVIELYFVNTEYQLADLFTKALGRDRIEFLINKLGMRSFTPKTLKQLTDEVDE